uniref:hypothetical protein n=1 Tax=Streptomyces sp. NBC_01562 TaxID=2975879 RepID=UPI002F913DD2
MNRTSQGSLLKDTQPDFVDVFTNPAIIGTDKKSDTPTLNKAVQPQGNTETR